LFSDDFVLRRSSQHITLLVLSLRASQPPDELWRRGPPVCARQWHFWLCVCPCTCDAQLPCPADTPLPFVQVTTNKFHLKGSRLGPREDRLRDDLPGAARKANPEILEHNRKRAVEVKLLELRETLEAQGCGNCHGGLLPAFPQVSRRLSEEAIDEAVDAQRATLTAQATRELAAAPPQETHALSLIHISEPTRLM
jgi:hypothetical protein